MPDVSHLFDAAKADDRKAAADRLTLVDELWNRATARGPPKRPAKLARERGVAHLNLNGQQ